MKGGGGRAAQREDPSRVGGTEVPYGQLGEPCPWRSEQHTDPTLTPEVPASATHAAAHQGPSVPLDSRQQTVVLPGVRPWVPRTDVQVRGVEHDPPL